MALRAVGWSFEWQSPREPEYGMFKEPIITHKLKVTSREFNSVVNWLTFLVLMIILSNVDRWGLCCTSGCVTLWLKHSTHFQDVMHPHGPSKLHFKLLVLSTCSCRVSASPLPAKKISYHSSSDNNSLVPTSAWERGYGNKYQQCDTTASLVCSRPS